MKNINIVVLCGNLTRDPEVRYTGSGMCVTTFSLAVNDSKKNTAGQWEDVAGFFDVKMFGKRAESLSKMLVKGQKVTVSGKLAFETWSESKTGQRRSKVSIIASDVELMARGGEPQFSTGAPQAALHLQSQYTQPQQPQQAALFDDGPLPF